MEDRSEAEELYDTELLVFAGASNPSRSNSYSKSHVFPRGRLLRDTTIVNCWKKGTRDEINCSLEQGLKFEQTAKINSRNTHLHSLHFSSVKKASVIFYILRQYRLLVVLLRE